MLQTPLHLACITGNTPLVEMICASNPQSIRVADRHGNNAVHLAIKYATPDTVQSVVKATSNKQWLEAKNLYGKINPKTLFRVLEQNSINTFL